MRLLKGRIVPAVAAGVLSASFASAQTEEPSLADRFVQRLERGQIDEATAMLWPRLDDGTPADVPTNVQTFYEEVLEGLIRSLGYPQDAVRLEDSQAPPIHWLKYEAQFPAADGDDETQTWLFRAHFAYAGTGFLQVTTGPLRVRSFGFGLATESPDSARRISALQRELAVLGERLGQ